MRARSLQRLLSLGAVPRWSMGVVARAELVVLGGHKDREVCRLIRRVRRERQCLVTGNEAYLLHSLARTQAALDADMAELGVFEGATAKLLCAAKGERTLHLFDTFTGLPGDDPTGALRQHQFRAEQAAVADYLRGYPAVRLHPGHFPQSAQGLERLRFSLVHLDVDLYDSTRAGLEFFAPRLVPGGVLVCHDYSVLAGVRAAVDEFVAGDEFRLLELPSTQVLVTRAR